MYEYCRTKADLTSNNISISSCIDIHIGSAASSYGLLFLHLGRYIVIYSRFICHWKVLTKAKWSMCHTDKRNVQRVKQALPTIRCLWTVHIIVCRISRKLVLTYTVFKDCMFWDVVFRRILSIGVHTHSPGTGRLYIHKCISRIFYSDSLFCFKAPESTIGKCSFCVNDSTLCDACIDAINIFPT